MFSASSWLHLRFPFSFFLLPIFLFSLSISPNFNGSRIGWVFFIIHFLVYPASNGYNSYFDKDEKSIGALKNPPPVNHGLYWLSLTLDAMAIVLSYLMVNVTFAIMVLIYGLVSKAYSHPSIRLKKYAIFSWVITGIFQGAFTIAMCYVGLNNFPLPLALKTDVLVPCLLASIMLWANYPMTQIYQHEEDRKRGDHTISQVLGVKGTFIFCGIFFLITATGFFGYLSAFFDLTYSIAFLLMLSPVLFFFLYWFFRVRTDESKANYSNAMWLNLISSTCMNGFFVYLFLNSSQVVQALQGGF